MATIRKILRESGVVYQAYIRKRGHKPLTKTFKTRAAAERWARKLEAGMDEDNAGLTSEAQRHTFNETVERYEREVLPELGEGTAAKYRGHLGYWQRKFGHLRLSEITPAKIDAARDELTRTPIRPKTDNPAGAPRYRSPATVNRHLATLAAVLTAAVKRWHWLTLSPMSQVHKATEGNARSRFLSEDELHRLLAACRESRSPDLYLAVLLSITTGARHGEILGLCWQDIDLDAGTMVVRADNETVTKGGARALPIVPEALELLRARKAAQQGGKVAALRPAGLLFPSRVSTTQPVDLRKPWETALARAGITEFRWHDMRHSAASFLAKGGASLLEIGAVLGHKTPQTTKRYAHLTESHTHALVRGMAERVLGEGRPRGPARGKE